MIYDMIHDCCKQFVQPNQARNHARQLWNRTCLNSEWVRLANCVPEPSDHYQSQQPSLIRSTTDLQLGNSLDNCGPTRVCKDSLEPDPWITISRSLWVKPWHKHVQSKKMIWPLTLWSSLPPKGLLNANATLHCIDFHDSWYWNINEKVCSSSNLWYSWIW